MNELEIPFDSLLFWFSCSKSNRVDLILSPKPDNESLDEFKSKIEHLPTFVKWGDPNEVAIRYGESEEEYTIRMSDVCQAVWSRYFDSSSSSFS